ncbi:hypothetical protein ACQPW3_37735 [Actinosynnema sp. CA-248983]
MRPVTALLAALLITATPVAAAPAAAQGGFPGASFTLTPLEVQPGGVITANAPPPRATPPGSGR